MCNKNIKRSVNNSRCFIKCKPVEIGIDDKSSALINIVSTVIHTRIVRAVSCMYYGHGLSLGVTSFSLQIDM